MSQKRKYRPAGKSKRVKWFGFYLTPTAAQLLFIGSLITVILCVIGLLWMAIGLINMLSLYSAAEASSGMSGFAATYGQSVLVYYLVYMVIIFIILAIAIYTINRTKQMRG